MSTHLAITTAIGFAWAAGLATLGYSASAERRFSFGHHFALGCAVAIPVMLGAAALGLRLDLAGAALCIVGIVGLVRRPVAGAIRWPDFEALRSPVGLLAAIALLPALLTVPLVARPVLSFDPLSYHIPLAVAARSGVGLGALSDSFYGRLPLGATLLQAPVSAWDPQAMVWPGARALAWVSVLATAALASRVARRLGARRAGSWTAAALVLWHPAIWDVQVQALSDGFVAMFALACADRLLSIGTTGRPRTAFEAALLAGSAAAVKLSALGTVAGPLAIVGLVFAARHRTRAGRLVLAAVVGGAIAVGPWAVRSTIAGGHPAYPMAGESPAWSAEQAAFVVEQHHPRSPASADYWSSVVRRTGVWGLGLRLGTAEDAAVFSILPVLALGALRRRRGGVIALLSASIAGYFAWNLVGLNPERFFIGAAMLTIPIVAVAVTRMRDPLRLLWAGLLGLAFLAGVRDLSLSIGFNADGWAELRRTIVPPQVVETADQLAADGRVLLLFESRPALFAAPTVSNVVWDVPPWAGELKAARDARDFADRLRAAGVESIFVNEFEFGRLVDFYGGGEDRVAGTVGIRTAGPAFTAALDRFPPFRFAGFEPAERDRLVEFLRLCRREATASVPAGPGAELWAGPLPSSSNGIASPAP